MYIYIYVNIGAARRLCAPPVARGKRRRKSGNDLRPIFIRRILRPRIFESRFRDHCAKKLDSALRKSTSFV